jgi:hypothetical protein
LTSRPIEITTQKLVDLKPTWAPFVGWSVLFDNPHLPVAGKSSPWLTTDPKVTSPVEFYERLAGVISRLASDLNEPGLAWLPEWSYHVTLADGVSQRNIDRLPRPDAKTLWADLLGRMPSSVAEIRGLLESDQGGWADLMFSAPAPPITFGIDALEMRGHALVAGLKPSTSSDDDRLRQLRSTREAAVSDLAKDTGLDLLRPLRPHLTIGYVANLETAESLVSRISAISRHVNDALSDVTITFRSADVYAFTSMVEFWK